jgi:nucleotide-binding universal stress UspA family protein
MLPRRPDGKLSSMQPERKAIAKVIIGYDGRARSDDALVLGRVLGEALGAELVVAAAVGFEPARIGVSNYNEARAAFFKDVFERAESVLGGIGYERFRIQDTPAHGLHMLAEETEAAALVVGSTHQGPVGRVYPGSVADRLMHGAPCPVAIAPVGYAERDGGIHRISVGVDGRAPSTLALRFAIDLVRRVSGTLTLLRVGPDMHWGTMGVPPVDEIDAANRKALKAMLAEVPDDLDAESHYCVGDPASELVRHSAEEDLLVLGSRGYGPVRSVLLGSVSSFVVRNAATPVVVMPRGVESADPAGEAPLPASASA